MNLKLKEHTKHNIFVSGQSICIFIAIVGIVFSVYLFMAGYHNLDLGWNIETINLEYNLSLVDMSGELFSDSTSVNDAGSLIHTGNYQMRVGFFLGLAVAFILGFVLSSLISLAEREET